MSDYLWRCKRPGCEYCARGGAATNFSMVMAHHEGDAHADEPAYSDEVKACEPWVEAVPGAPEFSEDPSAEGVRFICLRPGCSYDVGVLDGEAAGDVGIHHEATAHFGEPAFHETDQPGWPYTEVTGTSPDWQARLQHYIDSLPENEAQQVDTTGYRLHFPLSDEPIQIWDDPPPDPDRPFDEATVMEWYRQRMAETKPLTEAELAEDPVRCATWLYPAVVAALAAGVVYLSYRWTDR